MGCVAVSKFGLSVALGSVNALISNAFDVVYAATALLKPANSGIQIIKSGLYIVLGRFSITTPNGSGRCGCGIRSWKSESNYSDIVDTLTSSGNLNNTYSFIRIGYYEAGIYLRPIASARNGGTCDGCNLTVISLKAD